MWFLSSQFIGPGSITGHLMHSLSLALLGFSWYLSCIPCAAQTPLVFGSLCSEYIISMWLLWLRAVASINLVGSTGREGASWSGARQGIVRYADALSAVRRAPVPKSLQCMRRLSQRHRCTGRPENALPHAHGQHLHGLAIGLILGCIAPDLTRPAAFFPTKIWPSWEVFSVIWVYAQGSTQGRIGRVSTPLLQQLSNDQIYSEGCLQFLLSWAHSVHFLMLLNSWEWKFTLKQSCLMRCGGFE